MRLIATQVPAAFPGSACRRFKLLPLVAGQPFLAPRNTFHTDGKIIDLDAIVAGLDLT